MTERTSACRPSRNRCRRRAVETIHRRRQRYVPSHDEAPAQHRCHVRARVVATTRRTTPSTTRRCARTHPSRRRWPPPRRCASMGRAGSGGTPSRARCNPRRRCRHPPARRPSAQAAATGRHHKWRARTTAALQALPCLRQHRAQDLLHLVELLLPADERGSELDDRVAPVVTAADESGVEERAREEPTQQALALVIVERLFGALVL